MSANDLVPLLGPLAAFIAPLLVWAAANARLRHDARVSHADQDATLWERMAAMVDRYGARADQLEAELERLRTRVNAAENESNALSAKLAHLEVTLTRWRAYAVALIQQVRGAGLTPIAPEDYGIADDTPTQEGNTRRTP